MIAAIAAVLSCGCVSLAPASVAGPQCHTTRDFLVVEQPLPEDAGNRFAISRLEGRQAAATCKFEESKADFVIGSAGDALWFGEIAGHTLVLNRSTGPQGDLVVYDLDSGKIVLDVPADEYVLKDEAITYWQRTERATAVTCPSFAENEANGLGSVIAVEKTFGLAGRTVTDTGASKCVAVQ